MRSIAAMAKVLVKIPDGLSVTDCYSRMDEIDAEILQLTIEAAKVREALAPIDLALARLHSEKQQLDNRARELRKKPHVSDHALIRYLERRYDFDSDAVRAEMLTPEVKSAIKSGATGFKSHGGTFKFNGTTIVTFTHPKKH